MQSSRALIPLCFLGLVGLLLLACSRPAAFTAKPLPLPQTVTAPGIETTLVAFHATATNSPAIPPNEPPNGDVALTWARLRTNQPAQVLFTARPTTSSNKSWRFVERFEFESEAGERFSTHSWIAQPAGNQLSVWFAPTPHAEGHVWKLKAVLSQHPYSAFAPDDMRSLGRHPQPLPGEATQLATGISLHGYALNPTLLHLSPPNGPSEVCLLTLLSPETTAPKELCCVRVKPSGEHEFGRIVASGSNAVDFRFRALAPDTECEFRFVWLEEYPLEWTLVVPRRTGR